MDKPLESLDDYNERMAKMIAALNTYPRPNGLACPKCGAELQDSDGMVLTSHPAQRSVNCSKCDYQGYRIA